VDATAKTLAVPVVLAAYPEFNCGGFITISAGSQMHQPLRPERVERLLECARVQNIHWTVTSFLRGIQRLLLTEI
jgi:hypothetical protein